MPKTNITCGNIPFWKDSFWTKPLMNRFFSILSLALTLISVSANAEFISEDPALGQATNPPSLHRYLYAYQNPTVYIDPDGRTAQQFEGAMTAAVETYRNSGNKNRAALGTAGEVTLERMLSANGEVIIKGPATAAGAHNADIISYNPETKKVSFFDNKIQTKKANVSRANNLADPKGRQKSITEAMNKLESLNHIEPSMKRKIRSQLRRVRDDTSKGIWAVANATPEELAEVDNKVKRVSRRLVDKGVRFADISQDGIKMLSAEDSMNNGKKAIQKLGKAVPVAGIGVAAAINTGRLNAASKEDAAYRQTMQSLGIGTTAYDNHSFQREAAIIAAEELGGESGGAGGAAAAAVPSAACGPLYVVCVGAGAVAGGLAGDSIGGYAAGRSFDSLAEQNAKEEIERIRKAANSNTRMTVENPSGAAHKYDVPIR